MGNELSALLAVADLDEHVIGVLEPEGLCDLLDRAHRLRRRDTQPVLAHFARELIVPCLEIVATRDLREIGTDLRTGRGSLHDIEPIA